MATETIDRRIAEALADYPLRVSQARRMADLVRTGQLDPASFTVDTWRGVLEGLGQMMDENPELDWTPAIDRYVRPLLGSNAPPELQGVAADLLAKRATVDRVDPGLLAWIETPSGSQLMFQRKAQTLRNLLSVASGNPRVQEAYTLFMTRYAPRGTITSAAFGPTGAAELLQLYGEALDRMPQELWDTLPRIGLPERSTGLPVAYRRLAEALAQAELARQGQTVLPGGIGPDPRVILGDLLRIVGPEFTTARNEQTLSGLGGDTGGLRGLARNLAERVGTLQQPTVTGQDIHRRLPRSQSLREVITEAVARARAEAQGIEQAFELVRPILEAAVTDRAELRAFLDSLPWSERLDLFGGSADLYNRVLRWIETGR